MSIKDILLKKRSGDALTDAEIEFFVHGFTGNRIPDYQASALLMAIYFQGLNKKETIALTQSMITSGEVLDLSSIRGIKVDKHSTGGVGDKTTLVLAPLVAAAGVPVAKLSGRGLGHTGGTIDKLESFRGFHVELTKEEFLEQVKSIGIAVAAQSANLVPADKKLYALRDVTATVENKSLIAASIMSKKLASGADAIVLDVKCGDGAFMKNKKEATELARLLVDIGNSMGKKTMAVITDMEQPLGNAIGNALEVKEAIETLRGNGPKDLQDLCIAMGAQMLLLAKAAKNEGEAKKKLQRLLSNGKAFGKFKEFIVAQGGDVGQAEKTELLPQAHIQHIVTAPKSGFIKSIRAEGIGNAAMLLGAGRLQKGDAIDLSAGIVLHKKAGEKIKIGEKLAILYTNNESKLAEAEEKLLAAYSFSPAKPKNTPLILGKVI
ncbi:MAG: pyrimidine-nucleoside phosphorylase [Chitinophagales bacterium]|nr:pyrimidine-nucleoside phosphorylase [Chitinophagales bacterium]